MSRKRTEAGPVGSCAQAEVIAPVGGARISTAADRMGSIGLSETPNLTASIASETLVQGRPIARRVSRHIGTRGCTCVRRRGGDAILLLVTAVIASSAAILAQQTVGRWEHLEDDLQRKLAAEGKRGAGFSGTGSDSSFGGVGDTETSEAQTGVQGEEGTPWGAGTSADPTEAGAGTVDTVTSGAGSLDTVTGGGGTQDGALGGGASQEMVPRAFAEMRPLRQEVFRNYSSINFVFFR